MRLQFRLQSILSAAALVLVFAGCGDDDNTNDNNDNGNTPAVCGNGTVEAGEECDDGADNSDTAPGACRSNCRSPFCGDGVLDTDEACDEGAANSDRVAGACRTDYTEARCGDGVVDPSSDPDRDEECDDGAANSDTAPGACRTTCRLPACGDGVVDPGQHCYVFGAQFPDDAVGFPQDFDGNALLDYLTYDDGLGGIYTQDSTGVFVRQGGSIWLDDDGLRFDVGDFDGDGDGDLVSGPIFAENRGGPGAVPALQSPWVVSTDSEGSSYDHPKAVVLLQHETQATRRLALLPSDGGDIWLAEVSPEGYITKWPDSPVSQFYGDFFSAQAVPDVSGEGWPEVLICYDGNGDPCQLLHVFESGGQPQVSQENLPRALFFTVPARLFSGDAAGILGLDGDPTQNVGLETIYLARRGGDWVDTTQTGVDDLASAGLPATGTSDYVKYWVDPAGGLRPEIYIHRMDVLHPETTNNIERWIWTGSQYELQGDTNLDTFNGFVLQLVPVFPATTSTPPDLVALVEAPNEESLVRLHWQTTQYVAETYPRPADTCNALVREALAMMRDLRAALPPVRTRCTERKYSESFWSPR